MKKSYSFVLVGFVVIIVAASVAYSLNMKAQVRELDRRLQRAEALLQSKGQASANDTVELRVARLEQKVRSAELAESQAQLLNNGGTAGLAERILQIERNAKPHLEELPPYVPGQ